MKIGIIGLPRSGKTTLWSLLIDTPEGPDPGLLPHKPRMKMVKLEDPRLERLRDDYRPKKYTPIQIEVYDFPGVRKEGADRSGIADLLAPARDMEALIVVLRGFEEEGAAAPDLARDFQEIRGELVLSDLVIVERRLQKLEAQIKKHVQKTFEDDRRERDLLNRILKELEAERDLAAFPFTPEERKRIGSYQFLSSKPQVVVLNRGEEPSPPAALGSLARVLGSEPLQVAARSELEISALPPEERGPFLLEYGIGERSRESVIAESYRATGRISFLTAADKEVHAWSIRAGQTAVEAAGEVHSDMQRGFIRAEVLSYQDYVQDGGIKGARERGHLRLEGREYVVQDGDIIEFRFSI